jgi:hypothetical protein
MKRFATLFLLLACFTIANAQSASESQSSAAPAKDQKASDGKAASPQGEQQKAQPPFKPVNLKILPKEISRNELIQTMRGFAMSLGVRCPACHAGQEGQMPDFASDEKPMKNRARTMMLITQDLNKNQIPKLQLGTDKEHKVTCWTCHRGKQVPETEVQMPAHTEGAQPPTQPQGAAASDKK